TPDGGRDDNVFDIMQGIGIILAIKNAESRPLAEIYHADIYGLRRSKFEELDNDSVQFSRVSLDTKSFNFTPTNTRGLDVYNQGVALNELMPVNSVGIVTAADDTLVD